MEVLRLVEEDMQGETVVLANFSRDVQSIKELSYSLKYLYIH